MNAIYDVRTGITRDADGRAVEITPVDYWWDAGTDELMPIYRLGDHLICAYGWNGEAFIHSFEVADKFTAIDDAECVLTPIYRYADENRDPNEDAEEVFEIVGLVKN